MAAALLMAAVALLMAVKADGCKVSVASYGSLGFIFKCLSLILQLVCNIVLKVISRSCDDITRQEANTV